MPSTTKHVFPHDDCEIVGAHEHPVSDGYTERSGYVGEATASAHGMWEATRTRRPEPGPATPDAEWYRLHGEAVVRHQCGRIVAQTMVPVQPDGVVGDGGPAAPVYRCGGCEVSTPWGPLETFPVWGKPAASEPETREVQITVTRSARGDGAVLVIIDTPGWEPNGSDGGPGLRVLVNEANVLECRPGDFVALGEDDDDGERPAAAVSTTVPLASLVYLDGRE